MSDVGHPNTKTQVFVYCNHLTSDIWNLTSG